MITRRTLLMSSVGFASLVAANPAVAEPFEVTRSEAEWRKFLSPGNIPSCGRAAPSGHSPVRSCTRRGAGTTPARDATLISFPRAHEVRLRNRVAELLEADPARRRGGPPRPDARDEPHGGRVQPLRRTPRARVRRRPPPHRPALLHERGGHDVQVVHVTLQRRYDNGVVPAHLSRPRSDDHRSCILPVLPFVFARPIVGSCVRGLPMLVGMAATRSASLIAVCTHTPSPSAEIGVDR